MRKPAREPFGNIFSFWQQAYLMAFNCGAESCCWESLGKTKVKSEILGEPLNRFLRLPQDVFFRVRSLILEW